VTPDTEINPFINGRFTGPSEPLSAWPCLLGSWKERRDPRDRTDRHTGGATNTNICITLGPSFFHFWDQSCPQSNKSLKNPNTYNVKCQSSNVKSNPKLKCHKLMILNFDRNVPRKPRLVGGVKGHNINDITLPGSPALWAGSFKIVFSIVFEGWR
jgi:hypothetical protein